ncbi:flagellar motor switch protein FliN [Agromyces soli]
MPRKTPALADATTPPGSDDGAIVDPLAASAARALVASLPSERGYAVGGPVRRPVPAEAFEASAVGSVSVDVAVGFAVAGTLAHEELDARNLVHPALTAAASVYGPGVLGEVREGAGLFDDDAATVLELLDEGSPVGWFAVRPRAAAGPSRPEGGAAAEERLGRINGVEMALTVEIGRTRMTVRDVLGLEPGAVVELDRSAGAPADILLNGRVIAHGEVVVVDQDYAVRVTRILDAPEGAR